MWYFFFKRVIDIFGSVVGLILLSPLLILVVILIKIGSTGPIFAESQERVGRNGNIFRMYKFRSMIKNAYEVLRNDPRLKKLYEQYKKNSFKIKTEEDPRITKVGRFIRTTSIDELPQLINVLKGEMSLVGPRAFHIDELKEQQKRFPQTRGYVQDTITVKPGITGPWQISGRSSLDFPERVKLDAQYAKNKSILYDSKILLKTIPAVLRGEGG